MTKQDLQKELLEKVKPGTKPSDIRKLKRSKSADDLPNPSPSRLSELETENTELKKELEEEGAKFVSTSDTEVVLYAYKHWGTGCLDKFNGMWSFCIYDEEKQERDQAGPCLDLPHERGRQPRSAGSSSG